MRTHSAIGELSVKAGKTANWGDPSLAATRKGKDMGVNSSKPHCTTQSISLGKNNINAVTNCEA